MKQYNWGILAPGRIANKFAEGLAVLPDAVRYAVGSRDIGRAKEFADKFGFKKTHGSYTELAEDPDVDIIYVATPHTFHEEAAILCLKNGKAVICEKPFAVNERQAERMIRCAEDNKVFLMEAMWTRFLPVMVKLRELLDAGVIGKVGLVSADFGFRSNVNPEGRLFNPALAGGSLLDVGVYNLSMCNMVYKQEPKSIKSQMRIGSTGVDEECSVMLQYEEGQSALLFSAIRLASRHDAIIVGEMGRIEIPSYWHGTSLKVMAKDLNEEFDLPFEASGYQFEALEVMNCLEKGLKESPLMSLKDSLGIIRTMDLVRRDNKLRYPCDED